MWPSTEVIKDLPGDVSLDASPDFAESFAFSGSAFDIIERWRMTSHPDDCDPVHGCICPAIAATIEPVPVGFSA